LVANLTDDDGDGEINLCDVPDVVTIDGCGRLWIIDGASGNPHVAIEGVFTPGLPALADLDLDGTPEIIAVATNPLRLQAWRPSGELLWDGEPAPAADNVFWAWGAIAVHDVDADGSPEILVNHDLFDATGHVLWSEPDSFANALQASIAVDLDGDGDLELVTSDSAIDFAGDFASPQTLWDLSDVYSDHSGLPVVADFDGDGAPEVFYTGTDGFFLVTADGGRPWGNAAVKPAIPELLCDYDPKYNWQRPSAVHDFDDDGHPEVATSVCNQFGIYDVDMDGVTLAWHTEVQDGSGSSGASAFDFLADGQPEAIYGDEISCRAFVGQGGDFEAALVLPRASATWMEYPVIADVDNQGSAEFVVPSMGGTLTVDGVAQDLCAADMEELLAIWADADPYANPPMLQVYTDASECWVQARRIYNQHAYDPAQVREDASIVAAAVPTYLGDNTFRVNTAIDNPPGACEPAG
jgi:hypothetical protein